MEMVGDMSRVTLKFDLLRHVRREWALLLFQDVCLSVCMYVCMSVGQHQMPAAPADGAAAGAAGAAAA